MATLISRKIWVAVKYSNLHTVNYTVWQNEKFTPTYWKNISWNQLISNSNLSKLLVNTLHSRNICQIVRDWIFDFSTLCESEFLNFPHCGLQTWSSRNVSFSLLCFSIHSKAFKRSVEIAAYNNKIQKDFVGGNITQCGNCKNLLSHFFDKNFVKAMYLLK